MRCLARTLPWLLPLLATLHGCADRAGEADAERAQQTFQAFQAALQRHDEAACRELLTSESATALATMPWERVQAQQALEVLGAERRDGEFRVQVRDPNDGGQVAEFVVVREYGRFVVDLVATAGLHSEVREASGSPETVVPRELTPNDYDRIHQYELAQPPR